MLWPSTHVQISRTKYRRNAKVYVGDWTMTTMPPKIECSLNADGNDFSKDARIADVRSKDQKTEEK